MRFCLLMSLRLLSHPPFVNMADPEDPLSFEWMPYDEIPFIPVVDEDISEPPSNMCVLLFFQLFSPYSSSINQ